MRRRDLSKVLLASAAGTTLVSRSASAQSCNAPCYPQTAVEASLGVTSIDDTYPSHEQGGVVYPQRYGFSASASGSANRAALQTAVSVAAGASTVRTVNNGFAYFTLSAPELHLPEGEFSMEGAVNLQECAVIRGNKTILHQTSSGANHLQGGQPYRWDIEGVTFVGGQSAVSGVGPKLDSSRVRVARCEFQTGNAQHYAVVVDTSTCNTLIEDCLVLNSPLFADVYGDFCEIRDCWVNGYLRSTMLKPDYTASVNNRARHMNVIGGSWVPQGDGVGASTGTRWFNNRGGVLSITDAQFGAENGGLPIVYEYGSAVSTIYPYVAICGVIIRGGQLAQGHASRADRGVVVLQDAVPSLIDIRGGMFIANGALVSDAGFTSSTLAEWISANLSTYWPRIRINIEDVGEFAASFVPESLLPFARISKQSRGVHPGSHALGALNEKVTEYYPSILNSEAHIASNVAGQKRDPAASVWFDAVQLKKEPNGLGGSGAGIIDLEVVAVGEIAGPVIFTAQSRFRITILAGRNLTLRAKIQIVAQDNDQTGGTPVGNAVECRVVGATTMAATVQLRLNTALASGSGALCWSARVVSVANTNGRVLAIESA